MLNACMPKRKPHHAHRHRSKRADGSSPPPSGRSPRGRGRAPSRGEYWIYGTHAALAALANPARKCGQPRVTTGFKESHADHPALAEAIVVDRAELDAELPEHAVHQGIAVRAAPLPDLDLLDVLAEIAPGAKACVAVLDQATDPRNVGAVLRSAAAFGVSCVVMQDRHAPPETGAMAKAASGTLEQVPIIRVTNLARSMEALKEAGFWCVGLDGAATANLSEVNLDGPTALVFGAEGKGLRRLTRETCDVLVRIPLADTVESLNLANAVSVALYEWAR